ncbi:chromatin-remodeling ATPase INO80-like isoform X2 [Babylonia areolata]|uniref:chromatin-remodeling ATPase INO80-like isoform X2 n=1 Tax=Babylonia areolata TaxID=304850 RepID=UPI003FD2D382
MSFDSILEHNYGQLARPVHVQQLESALRLEPFLSYAEKVLTTPVLSSDDSSDEADLLKPGYKDAEGNKILNGITISKTELKADKTRLYNFNKIRKNRRWLRTILLSDSSSEDENDERPVNQEDVQAMLKMHKHQKRHQARYYHNPQLRKYMYYSSGLLSNYDKFPEHYKTIVGPKKKISKDQKKIEKKVKAKLKKLKKDKAIYDEDDDEDEIDPTLLALLQQQQARKERKPKKLTPEQADAKRRKIWVSIAKKEIPKAQKQKASARKEMLTLLKKVSQQCVRDRRRGALQSQKTMKETPSRARRLTREMLIYWKRFEKVEKEHRKRAEKEAQEQRKHDLELMEARRQQRKLNFLITQTELYAHFMARKMTGETNARRDAILNQLDDSRKVGQGQRQVDGGMLVDDTVDDYNPDDMKKLALKNAEGALKAHEKNRQLFGSSGPGAGNIKLESLESSLANPSTVADVEQPQPNIFVGKLKGYQLKGMNWLANLYNQGINGILADEMGLGKTVQSIAFLAHLSETQGIWGPFLVIAPASTLHNWQQEVSRFVPEFKVVPYWGNTQDRKVLRKFWDSKLLHTKSASFHVVITSYQLVIQDVKYFQRIKWQYLVLDEAQAIKSTSSARWKILLGFNCRNRLLLTGTPIQNSMAELWALLHFIMPTMFDSHDEFNEWFSKDIENHAERQSGIDADQLSRLHMILKPFMLRRVKKDVENELSDKIEIMVNCPLTKRQKQLYQAIKNKISIDDLVQSTTSSSSQSQSTTSSLMNLVMQFRKVCNHPELFERKEARTPFCMLIDDYNLPKQVYRDGIVEQAFPSKNHILYNKLYIHSPAHVHQALFHQDGPVTSCQSFLFGMDMSPQQLYSYMFGGFLVRWLGVFLAYKAAYRIHQRHQWQQDPFSARDCLNLAPLAVTSMPNLASSPVLGRLVFTQPTGSSYTYLPHTLHYMQETTAHRHTRARHIRMKKSGTPPTSPTKHHSPVKSPTHGEEFTLPVHPHKARPPKVLDTQLTSIPRLVCALVPKVVCPPRRLHCVDRSAEWDRLRQSLCGTLETKRSLLYGCPELYWERCYPAARFSNELPGGLCAVLPHFGWHAVQIPDKESLVSDAGKLYVLDSLLQRLKREGHRVLIYSQMTRMIDLLEEYMVCRKHTFKRLDGSSRISDRRDMVADFQTKSDIFVFLLSTRAGGLGINLTAADTVIFYDSDWNPTVDQQAMDRAHRLGQTKQVTVYRLICQGTIEERILQRAKEKSEIQKMVISGGSYRPDTLKPTEVVSLLIDDAEMEKKLRQRQEERKEDGRKRRRKEYKKRESKKPKKEAPPPDINVTIPAPAPDTESLASYDSFSMPASPMSTQVSWNSELPLLGAAQEDSSNDGGLVIVDDAHTIFPPVTSTPVQPVKKGRGRPRGSGVGRRPRGRGSAKKTMTAAEIAGAHAGMTAAYAAYGYNFTGTSASGSPRPPGSRTSSGRNTPTV